MTKVNKEAFDATCNCRCANCEVAILVEASRIIDGFCLELTDVVKNKLDIQLTEAQAEKLAKFLLRGKE